MAKRPSKILRVAVAVLAGRVVDNKLAKIGLIVQFNSVILQLPMLY